MGVLCEVVETITELDWWPKVQAQHPQLYPWTSLFTPGPFISKGKDEMTWNTNCLWSDSQHVDSQLEELSKGMEQDSKEEIQKGGDAVSQ